MAVRIEANLRTKELVSGLNDPALWLYAAQEWHRLYRPYVPYREGFLYNSVVYGSGNGQATITHYMPYAHYMYEGVVYASSVPIVQGSAVTGYTSPRVPKYNTGRALTYSTLYSGMATKHWDQAAKATKLPLLEKAIDGYIKAKL